MRLPRIMAVSEWYIPRSSARSDREAMARHGCKRLLLLDNDNRSPPRLPVSLHRGSRARRNTGHSSKKQEPSLAETARYDLLSCVNRSISPSQKRRRKHCPKKFVTGFAPGTTAPGTGQSRLASPPALSSRPSRYGDNRDRKRSQLGKNKANVTSKRRRATLRGPS